MVYAYQTLMTVLFLLTKWTLIGKFKPGVYLRTSWYYQRWNLLYYFDIARKPANALFSGPLGMLVQKLLGAKMDMTGSVPDFVGPEYDLLEVGAHVKFGMGTNVC